MFRTEVLTRRSERLYGEPMIATPLAWSAIGYVLLGVCITAALLLTQATYQRFVLAPGIVTLDRGTPSIAATRAGVVTRLFVHEGMLVAEGAPIAVVRTEDYTVKGSTLGEEARRSLETQSNDLIAQRQALQDSIRTEIARIRQQREFHRGEIKHIRDQLKFQKQLVASAEQDFARLQTIASKGFISRRDISSREEILLGRRQRYAELQLALESKMQVISESFNLEEAARSKGREEVASLRAAYAELERQAGSSEAERSYVLRAPLRGTVSGLVARAGDTILSNEVLASLVPDRARVQVELSVKPSDIGLIQEGQQVLVTVDSFPQNQFGNITGKIVSLTRSDVLREAENGKASAFIATVLLSRTHYRVMGKERGLLPGMTVSGKIGVTRQPLWTWLAQPFQGS